ncbi:MAG: TatD family nuclease-associated radical SAM protein [Clostridia bacterium]|nr:TatD family nuclease-associated radical SAM protein [Clostridia bacterium]
MEENKNVNAQPNTAGENASNGGRKRRHKHRGGHSHGQNGQNGQNQQNQAQNTQQGQGQPKQQGQQKPQQGQKKNNQKQQNNQKQGQADKAQNAQKQAQPQQNQNTNKKNKNKDKGQAQPQKQNQNQSQNQNKNNQNGKANNKEENRKDTYLYSLDGNLYVNLTNKCSNGCDFCVRNERSSYYGNYLWLRNGDPTVEKVIAAANGFGDLSRFKEVVFCGFGEPTYKVAEMVALCDFFHGKGMKTRLNTNGQGNLINKRDIVPDLKGKIDFVNISLNASCVEKYQPICRSQYGEAGFAGMIDFAKLCRKEGVDCRFSIVDCIGEEEVEACKRLAESVRIPLYVRKYITDS